MFLNLRFAAVLLAAASLSSRAQSSELLNADPVVGWAWGANVGWISWQSSPERGAALGEFVASGYLYSPNIGWIHLGDGDPDLGSHYLNDSAEDYGVNHDQEGNLRGFAYSANAGWIHFEDQGAPRVNLDTGALDGFVYGANIGWIALAEGTASVRIDFSLPGEDADHDGLPDLWELRFASDLSALDGSADSDNDGQSDLSEYFAGTHPLDRESRLEITDFTVSPDGRVLTVTWEAQSSRRYRLETRPNLSPGSVWTTVHRVPPIENPQLQSVSFETPSPGDYFFFRIRADRSWAAGPGTN